MIEQEITHHIQRHIIKTLMHKESARFSELRPPKTDTNLFTYHLKQLIKAGLVGKNERLYTLCPRGLSYVDGSSTETACMRRQPKIISMLLVQNGDGQVVLQRRIKQPFINTWTLPYGKVRIDDASIEKAAQRAAYEKLGCGNQTLRHVGDCYIRVYAGDEILSSTLAHIFRFEADNIKNDTTTKWVEPLDLRKLQLAPAVEEIVTRCFFGDVHFFAEFDCDLSFFDKPDALNKPSSS